MTRNSFLTTQPETINLLLRSATSAPLTAINKEKPICGRNRSPSISKTPQAEHAIGWKTKQQVGIDIYLQAIQDAQEGLLGGIHKLQAVTEIKAAKVFMSAWSEAVKQGKTGLLCAQRRKQCAD